MSRRMSCSMTVDAVRDRSKTVTRRAPDTWKALKVGDRLTLVEKAMGLRKGEKQVVLAEVEIVDVRMEPLTDIVHEIAGCRREGFPTMLPGEFIRFWLKGHGYEPHTDPTDVTCRRIEWRYL